MENVNVIKLNDNTIEIDGVVYEKKAMPKSEFNVGDWVIGVYSGMNPQEPSRVFKIKEDRVYYLYTKDGREESQCIGIRPASHNEIESHLRKIAEEKGFKNGVLYRGARYNRISKLNGELLYFQHGEMEYMTDGNGDSVYSDGKWAEIVPKKKKLPKTKDELCHLIYDIQGALRIYKNKPIEDSWVVCEFLKDYED